MKKLIVLFLAVLSLLLTGSVLAEEGTLALPANLTIVEAEALSGIIGAKKVIVPEGVTTIGAGVFADSEFDEIWLPSTIRSIEDGAFRNTGAGTEKRYYLLPEEVNSGKDIFGGCTAKVYLDGEELAALTYTISGDKATVTGCNSEITSLRIPGMIEEKPVIIGVGAFQNRMTLEKVKMDEGVTKVDSYAFSGCVKLTDVTFPSTLVNLEGRSFENCGSASEEEFIFSLPNGISAIQATTFTGCPAGLMCVKDSTTAISLSERYYNFIRSDRPDETMFRYRWGSYDHSEVGLWLFEYTGNEQVVALPDDIDYVDKNTFSHLDNPALVCSQMSKTALGLSKYLKCTFPGHENVRYKIVDQVLQIVGFEAGVSEITIPEASAYINADYNEQVAEKAFQGNTALTKLVLPEGLTAVNNYGFAECVNLTDITFPSTLTTLGAHAFENCGSASADPYYYILPDHITSVNTGTGAGWDSFHGVTGDGATGVLVCAPNTDTAYTLSHSYLTYEFALKGHETDGLRYRYENKGTTESPDWKLYLWRYVGNAAEVEIPGNIGLYGVSRTPPGGSDTWTRAFQNSKNLLKIVIPEGVVEIQNGAFQGCKNLKDVTLPSTLKVIEQHAFEEAGSSAILGSRSIVEIPAGVATFLGNDDAGWSPFHESGFVLVAPAGSFVAQQLHDGYWVYYGSREDAEAKINLCHREEDQGHPYPEAFHGNAE